MSVIFLRAKKRLFHVHENNAQQSKPGEVALGEKLLLEWMGSISESCVQFS